MEIDQNKTVTVLGLSKRTGIATVKFLNKIGASIIVSDKKSKSELTEELDELAAIDFECDLNGHSEKSLKTDLIVVSPGVPLDIPLLKKAQKKGVPVISEIELAYKFNKAKIVAITGTNGKTTTTALLGNIFKKGLNSKVKVAGNIGTPMIKVVSELSAEDWLIVEVSSFQLEAIKEFRPEISIYLNFTPDHLDRHHTESKYFEAKRRIFENQKPSDKALINYEDEKVLQAAQNCSAEIFGVSLKKEIKKGIYKLNENLVIKLSAQNSLEDFKFPVTEIPLQGEHNISNTAFAILASFLAGIDPEIIKIQVKNFDLPAHRLQEYKLTKRNILIIDDSKATNPDAAIKALQSYNRPIILIAGGQDRGVVLDKFAKVISQKVKKLILLGETRYKLEKMVSKKICNGKIYSVKNMKKAVEIAFEHLDNGDCLLLSPGCPSWDMYSSYKKRGELFIKEVKKHGQLC